MVVVVLPVHRKTTDAVPRMSRFLAALARRALADPEMSVDTSFQIVSRCVWRAVGMNWHAD
jgi:hypothetical protein